MDRGAWRGRGRGRGGRGRGGSEEGTWQPDPRSQGRGRGVNPGQNYPPAAGGRGPGGYSPAPPPQEFEPATSGQPEYQATRGRGRSQNPPRGGGAWRSGGRGEYRAKDPMPSGPSEEPMVAEIGHQMAELAISYPGPSISAPSGAAASSSSSGALRPVSRPDGGGRNAAATVRLLANHFLVKFQPALQILHYDLEITQSASSSKPGGRGGQVKKKGRVSKADAQEIKNKLIAENRAAFGNALPVYDGEKNIFSSVPLPEGLFTVKLSKGEDCKVKEYTVALKLANKLDGKRLAEFLNPAERNHVQVQQEYLQALDLVLREHPSSTRIIVGRSLYPKLPERDGDLHGGAVASRGFAVSLRPTAQGLALNVDFSVVAFHNSMGVLDYLWENKKIDCQVSKPLNPRERKDAENALRGLKVKVNHRRTSQKFTVWRLTKQITRDLKFEICEDNGQKKIVGLVDYFKQRYGRDIQFQLLPCLDLSKTQERTNYVPMEFCDICEGQRYPRDELNGPQSNSLLRMACPPVHERVQMINDIMNRQDGPRGGPYAPKFQITVGADMTQVIGRILGAPQLKLGDGGQVRQVTPRPDDRQWNLLRSHVFEGKKIDKWGLISFFWDNPSRQANLVENFGRLMVKRCAELGIYMNQSPTVYEFDSMNKFSNVTELQRTLMGVYRKARGQLQILICVMEERHAGYKNLKLICETDVGLITQCCLFEHVRKCGDQKYGSQYLANLALKINAKVGGSNAALLNSLSHQLPRFGNSQVIYFGADVNHPGSRDEKSPSIAAVVASINWPSSNRYVAKLRSQKNRQEHIEQLGEMCKELLDEYLKVNKRLPDKVLFFRDGVSEGQFDMVLNKELIALKETFSRFKGYNPAVSFIIAQKRHHTRLFPGQGEQRTKSGNVPPGTVVDTKIVHPREFDFYLCSHYGLKGTSKPTHYHVLWDENSFTSDELQTLINNLCYTFARCTKPVSLAPPVYYADLAAYRGRQYVEGLTFPPSSETASSSSSSSSSTPFNFPKIHGGVESFMFFC
eukprot:Gb_13708 [translate_table: standard]